MLQTCIPDRCFKVSDRLAVALIPWYIADRDTIERSRAMLRIWAAVCAAGMGGMLSC